MKDGLKTLGVQCHADLFKPVMCNIPAPLTANMMESLFEPKMSVDGSSRRVVENRVCTWWLDMLLDSEGL